MSTLNLSKISFWVWLKPGKKYCFRSCILKWNHSSISNFTKRWWGVESSLKRAYYWKMATKLLKAQSQMHEWEEGGSNHPFNSPFNSSYAYWMMKKEATLKWFIWQKCDRSSLCSCDLLPHLSVLSFFACLRSQKQMKFLSSYYALFLFFCILHVIQSNQCIFNQGVNFNFPHTWFQHWCTCPPSSLLVQLLWLPQSWLMKT